MLHTLCMPIACHNKLTVNYLVPYGVQKKSKCYLLLIVQTWMVHNYNAAMLWGLAIQRTYILGTCDYN